MTIRVLHKIDLPRVHGDEEFSLDPPYHFLINKKIAITTAERLFLSWGILKTLPKIKHCLFVLRLNVPVNNFSVMSGRSHRFLGN